MPSALDNIAKEFTTHTMASLVKNPFVVDIDVPTYSGETEITPTEEVQLLATNGKQVNSNIIVNPIPSNYGKVIWDGIRLRIE